MLREARRASRGRKRPVHCVRPHVVTDLPRHYAESRPHDQFFRILLKAVKHRNENDLDAVVP